jgi:hypothetical protein
MINALKQGQYRGTVIVPRLLELLFLLWFIFVFREASSSDIINLMMLRRTHLNTKTSITKTISSQFALLWRHWTRVNITYHK